MAQQTSAQETTEEAKSKEPEQLDLTTKDGVMLKATFYPGAGTEKTVPLILLHDYKGDRSDLDELAKYLQALGHAVIVPDLRGHGDSTKVVGLPRELVATRMKPLHFGRMVTQDLEAVKRYLMGLNNKSQLNIQKLGVVGFGMGASLGIAWAAHDWSWPEFAALKQGRDVKALVLVSPDMNLRGLKIHDDLRHPAISDTVGIQIIVGNKKSDNRRDADSMYKLLTRNRPKQEEMKIANREVFLEPLDTSLQGVKLLGIKDLLIDKRIAKFVELRLTNINLPSFRWADRSRKN
ncbi:MAG: alpha/beta fold hydrolase [Pirellulales bacterium]|nr:alpha/beta fold hydrolase [Pirellulales bacterium]